MRIKRRVIKHNKRDRNSHLLKDFHEKKSEPHMGQRFLSIGKQSSIDFQTKD